MNPTNRQYTHQRQWKSLDPRQRTDSISRENKGNYSLNDMSSHTMKVTNAEMEHHNPSSHRMMSSNNFSPKKATDADGDPLELSKEDKELARKRRELQQIQEQISLKKATIAMKRTETFLKAKPPCRMFKEDRAEGLSHSKVDSSVENTQPFMSTLEKGVGFSESSLKAKTPCRMFKEDREEDLSHSKVDTSMKNTLTFMSTLEKGFSCSKWSSSSNNGPLKERVDVILQRSWPDGFLAKAFSTPSDHLPSPNPVEKTNTSSLKKDDHPLKLRVKALMNKHRNGELESHAEVPVVKPHPPSQSLGATVGENDLVVKGFQRFISLLNKGVDIDMLTKIVNDDEELPPTGQELLHCQTPVSEQKAEVCKGDSQQLQLGAGQRDHQSCSEERKTELQNQEISLVGSTRNVQPEVKFTRNNDGGGRHFGSCHRSRSPSCSEERKTELQNQETSHEGSTRNVQPEVKFTRNNDGGSRHFGFCQRSRSPSVDEKNPKLEQHQEQLQNILNTLGLSLVANDLCKLAERAQERLHGQKDDSSTAVSERRRQHLKRHYSPSSSSNSLSHSPVSQPHSSSPSRHQHSSSKTPRDSREKTQQRHSRKRSRERTQSSRYQNSRKTSKERVREREKDCDSRKTSIERVREREKDCDSRKTSIERVREWEKDCDSRKTSIERVREREKDCDSRKTSIERVREREKDCDSRKTSKETVRERENDCDGDNRIDSRDRSHYHHPSPGNPEYHAPYPAPYPHTASAIPTYNSDALATYTSVQHYTAYHNYYSNSASTAGSYGTNVIPHSSYSYPPGYVYHSVNPLYPPAYTGALPGQVSLYPHLPAGPVNDPSYFFNADLSQSEGQTGQDSGPRYLQVITTQKSKDTDRCLLSLTNGSWHSRNSKHSNARVNRHAKRQVGKKVALMRARADHSSANNVINLGQTSNLSSGITTISTNVSSGGGASGSNAQQECHKDTGVGGGASGSNAQQEDHLYHDMLSSVITTNTIHPEPPVEASTEVQPLEKALPTEDEIKANLKKKLAAFNEKMKHQVPKPTETQPNVNDW